MDYETDQQGYDDDNRGYRERSPRGENGNGRDRSASPDARDRTDGRPPIPPVPVDDDDESRNTGSNLFVTGIHPKLTEEDVTRLFEKFGQVSKCNIMRDPHSRDSRGFGFVNMATSEQADAAKEGLQGEVYEGRTLSIEKARRSKPRTPTPGKYFGPPKRGMFDFVTSLKPGDFRGPPRGGRFGDRYDDRRGPPRRRDDFGGGYRGDDRGYGRREDRYDDRGYGRRDRYDDRAPRDDRYGGAPRRDYYGGGDRGAGGAAPYGGEAATGSRNFDDRGDDRLRPR